MNRQQHCNAYFASLESKMQHIMDNYDALNESERPEKRHIGCIQMDIQEEQIREMLSRGLKVRQISIKLDVPYATLRRRMKRRKIKLADYK